MIQSLANVHGWFIYLPNGGTAPNTDGQSTWPNLIPLTSGDIVPTKQLPSVSTNLWSLAHLLDGTKIAPPSRHLNNLENIEASSIIC